MSGTGFLTHSAYLEHDAGPDNPERPARLTAILEQLEGSGVFDRVNSLTPDPAPISWIEKVHSAEHVQHIRDLSAAGTLVPVAADTSVSRATYLAATVASGGVLQAIDEVLSGRWSNAFCAHRPPGHHAETATAMGFCYFNHVAVGARYAQLKHGIERVAIIDWDVHHGNGTQDTFYDDPSVLFFSIHQFPLYPGTGARDERGEGRGIGATLNAPVAAGVGDAEYLQIFRDELAPAIAMFQPELILLSAGFDAHRRDPLGSVELSEEGYGNLTAAVMEMASDCCSGHLISLLEGGYDLQGTALSVQCHLEALSA